MEAPRLGIEDYHGEREKNDEKTSSIFSGLVGRLRHKLIVQIDEEKDEQLDLTQALLGHFVRNDPVAAAVEEFVPDFRGLLVKSRRFLVVLLLSAAKMFGGIHPRHAGERRKEPLHPLVHVEIVPQQAILDFRSEAHPAHAFLEQLL